MKNNADLSTLRWTEPHAQWQNLQRQTTLSVAQGLPTHQSRQPQMWGYSPEQQAVILHAYEERASLRRLTCTLGVAWNTVSRWDQNSRIVPTAECNAGRSAKIATLKLDEL